MNRRALLAAFLAVASVLPLPAAAGKRLPALAGDNTVTAVGPSAVEVALDAPVAINYRDSAENWFPLFEVSTPGPYAGLMIRELSPHPGGQTLLYIPFTPPAGCNQAATRCERISASWYAVHGPLSGPPETMTLEPGTYMVHVFTESGVPATIRFGLPGLEGTSSLPARIPFEAAMKMEISYPTLGSGQLTGSMDGHLSGKGLVIGGAAVAGIPRVVYVTQCVAPTDEARLDPLDTCGFPLNDGEYYFASGGPGQLSPDVGAGDWIYQYRVLASAPPDGQIFVFGLWLTFLV